MPQLPGGHDRVEPEGEHHDDDDNLFGRNVAKVGRVWHQSSIEADHRALSGHPGVVAVIRVVLAEQGDGLVDDASNRAGQGCRRCRGCRCCRRSFKFWNVQYFDLAVSDSWNGNKRKLDYK